MGVSKKPLSFVVTKHYNMLALSGKSQKMIKATFSSTFYSYDNHTITLPITTTEKIRGMQGLVVSKAEAAELVTMLNRFLNDDTNHHAKGGTTVLNVGFGHTLTATPKTKKPVAANLPYDPNKKPEKVTYHDYYTRKAVTIDLVVGVGATQSVGLAGNDSYPYTVWDWRITKGGTVYVYVTNDDYRYAGKVEGADRNGYVYQSKPPKSRADLQEVRLGLKHGIRLHIGHRAFYNSPEF